jgi:integrase
VIVLGPQAQAILTPILEGLKPADYVFSPRRASDQLRTKRKQRRVYGTGREPGTQYSTDAYIHAVKAAINRANKARAKAELPTLTHWRPNQLRHAMASAIAEEFDRSHSKACLGHSGVDVLAVYVEQELMKAAKVAAKMG